jgi:cholesterol oxidase
VSAQHFDAVVVGSGFGGSVTAYRLAEAGRSVCVLERGKPYPPNSFPRSPLGMSRNLWDPSAGLHGMFDLWSFEGLDALCASGLGGGSLIYANVILRKDEKWFVQEDRSTGTYEHWPVTRADLDPHYDRVERMLRVQRYPLDQPPYDTTAKTLAFKAAAEDLDLDWFLPNLAVTFANDGDPPRVGEPIREARPNLHGRPRDTCRLCGECDVGCNYGSKNTLDYTYLTDAWHAGADIRTRCEVRAFEPRDESGFNVHYVHHDEAAEGRATDTSSLPQVTLTCDHLILSGGTLGSTYLLLRNRAAFPALSSALGTNFSGNGDLLTFALEATRPKVIDPGRGPVITSAVRIPDAVDGGDGRGFYVEDAGAPQFVAWMLEVAEQPESLLKAVPPLLAHLVGSWLGGDRDTNLSAELSSLFGDCALSAGALPLLGMGRDVPDGNMSLDEAGLLAVDWSKHGASKSYFDRVRGVSEQIAGRLGARFVDNPIWHLNRVITVHSLGGCPMGRGPEEGVVDAYGEVFGHPGLHVADGSVMPGPVGANPSLTIAALADRFADAMLEGKPTEATPRPRARPSAPATPAAATADGAIALGFTEEMKGFVSFGADDFDHGFRDGRRSRTGLMFHLTITTDDLDRFIADPQHAARAEGFVQCDALGGERPVTRGDFNLFVDQPGDHTRKRMYYRLHFDDATEHPLTLTGQKVIEDDPGFDLWSDTTTLFTSILQGHVEAGGDDDAELVARGILHIPPLDFAHQLTTFRTRPPGRVDAIGRFGVLFAGALWESYGPR